LTPEFNDVRVSSEVKYKYLGNISFISGDLNITMPVALSSWLPSGKSPTVVVKQGSGFIAFTENNVS
jgi:hypothetical protein